MDTSLAPPVFLIGLPGCGKTTLGRALARRLGREFIDLDHYIEARFFCSVADFFARYGEERFRATEAALLREVGEMTGVVVACGGGTPCFHDGMDYMLSRGLTVHLQASRERLHERLCRRRERRPHLRSLSDAEVFDYIDSTMAARLPVYSRCHISFDSSMLEDRPQIDASVEAILPLILENTPLTSPNTSAL